MTTAPSSTPSGTAHKYTLTRWDLLRTQMHTLSRNWVVIAFFVVTSTVFALRELLRRPEMAVHSLIFNVLFVVLFDVVVVSMLFAVALLLLLLTILVNKHRGVLGEHTLEVTSSGLVERTEVNETVHRWHGFHRIVRTRRYLYLWVTDSMIQTVPVRSFASEDTARAFLHKIEQAQRIEQL